MKLKNSVTGVTQVLATECAASIEQLNVLD